MLLEALSPVKEKNFVFIQPDKEHKAEQKTVRMTWEGKLT